MHKLTALVLALFTLRAFTVAPPSGAADLQPLMAGWERHFTVSWEPAQYRGAPAVSGYLTNVSPYQVTNIRILVESLDAAGQLTAQKLAYVPGDLLGGGRVFFQVPAATAPTYRVRVFSYERVETDGTFR